MSQKNSGKVASAWGRISRAMRETGLLRRGPAVTLVVVLVILSALLGWWFGRSIRSPAQIAAEAEPPPPSLITVEVERLFLSANVITRADVGYDDPASLSLGGAVGGQPEVQVVTAVPERGAELIEGSIALEVAGRPVFLLEGTIPIFRDIRPGSVGPDVFQMESALARLGFFSGEPDEQWGDETANAVLDWYQASGYRANGISEDEQATLRAARGRVRTAADNLEMTQQALERGINGPSEAEVRRAEAAVMSAEEALQMAEIRLVSDDRAAQQAVRDAELARTRAVQQRDQARNDWNVLQEQGVFPAGSSVFSARNQVEAAEEVLQQAQDALEEVQNPTGEGRRTAEQSVRDAEQARDQAARSFARAVSDFRSAQQGVHPQTGNVPNAIELEMLRLAVGMAERALEDAERAITAAQEARDEMMSPDNLAELEETLATAMAELTAANQAVVDTEASERDRLRMAVDTTAQDLAKAEKDLNDARTTRDLRPMMGAASLRSARNALLDAQEARDELFAPADIPDLEEQVSLAEGEFNAASRELALLEERAGVWIPSGEVIFLRRLPVRVDALTVDLGSTVGGAFMTVTGSDLAVRGSVLARDFSLVRQGQEARIEDSAIPDPIPGVIRLLDSVPGTEGVANDRHYMEMSAREQIPDGLIGENVRIVIPVGGTDGEVWAVPAAALSATADGSTRIEVAQPDGSTQFISVEPGLTAQGLVEVTPLDGQIQAGDQVVVGVADLG